MSTSSLAKPPHPLLAAYLNQLALHPLKTKAYTTGILLFIQEVLASHIAGVPVQRPSKDAPAPLHVLARAKVTTKALKMALYGFLISAPLSHVLVGALQRAFAGKTSPKAKIGQLLASNGLIAPIQTLVYLASIAVINGARSSNAVATTVKTGFMPVLKVTWVISPISVIIAQNFLPPDLWVPFSNLVQFIVGTFFNTKVKRLQMAAQAKRDKSKEE